MDYLRVTPLTTYNTHNAFLKERTSNKCLISTVRNAQETIIRTINITQKYTQTPSHFVNEEVDETLLKSRKKYLPDTPTNYHTKKKTQNPIFHERPYNQQSNKQSFHNTHIWIIKQIDQQKIVNLMKKTLNYKKNFANNHFPRTRYFQPDKQRQTNSKIFFKP